MLRRPPGETAMRVPNQRSWDAEGGEGPSEPADADLAAIGAEGAADADDPPVASPDLAERPASSSRVTPPVPDAPGSLGRHRRAETSGVGSEPGLRDPLDALARNDDRGRPSRGSLIGGWVPGAA